MRRKFRRGFTLIELMVVTLIIVILAALSWSALQNVEEQAREERTRSIITRIDALLMTKWESYRTRAVPVRIAPGMFPQPTFVRDSARLRLYALRELMRLELPDRKSDVTNDPVVSDVNGYQPGVQTMPIPTLQSKYRRLAQQLCAANGVADYTMDLPNGWSTSHQQSECLYLILACMRDNERSALDFLSESEIGNEDGDAIPEIHDGWGRPIVFLRWAPGFTLENNAVTLQSSNASAFPDPFDPVKVDPRWGGTGAQPFALRPLVYSAGPDHDYDIELGNKMLDSVDDDIFRYVHTNPPNDPYHIDPVVPSNPQIGTPYDTDGNIGYGDNVTNHYLQAR